MSADGIVGEFLALKSETDADLLAMQCGDFYEFFAEDAEFVGDELDLKVSEKSSHGSTYPMAGVPVDDLTPYLKALVERGYRVAVADQYETEDGHAREITRVVTPGTLLETTDPAAQFLATITRVDGRYGLALADVTTGEFLVTTATAESDVVAECHRFDPVEVVPGPTVDADLLDQIREGTDATVTDHDDSAFAPGRAERTLREQFGEAALDSVGLDDRAGVAAAGALLTYVEETGVGVLDAMTRLRAYDTDDHLNLDATTQRNLELTETMHGGSDGSLLGTIDHTVTSAGRRRLREWLTRPSRNRAVIDRRLDSVAAFTEAALARDRVREILDDAYDLERLAARATSGSADASDLLAVRETLALLPALAEAIEDSRLADSPLADIVADPDREAAASLRAELDEALAEDPPGTVTEGGLIRRGYDAELDDLLDRYESAQEWLDNLAGREKERTGITHLQVDRNKTDGYYIQVGKSETGAVPDDYREIKTLKNSRRYTTEELDDREREVLRLEEARGELEYDLFTELRERVAAHADLLQAVGRTLATVDALASLATHAASQDWCRPAVVEPGPLVVEAGRHPVVETTTDFVPNDVDLREDRGFLLVTGPNMSGKSTYMRQAALIVLLAQAGSFVPARSATVGVVDGIYTRVGALDELAGGRSTFMVEMSELSNILHSATEDSLVVLDEVGRGTATYDGISIAWATTEYIHNEIGCKCLFATHYHELTALADHLPRVENVHVAVAGDGDDEDITFLRTIEDGPTDRSYGVHVADLAGVPSPVVDRSRDVLDRLREDRAIEARGAESGGETKQAVFDLSSGGFREGSEAEPTESDGGELDPATESVLDELEGTSVAETSPVDLMARVREWQERLEEGEK
ncbi:DNA mismatch repair protein MutS [Haloplanus vescus]|uniref:DNA mismatch repair protein MutS n=1 Tax=Haloplanus vescus TaxID=555874 RepID=A0A1H3ZJ06_9EURY|nr:DNA mismatch repair protein MutS [Haloplanus vescus]SEA23665.1 DNA mismatch repair protein MutS [Haloplanus vescus]